MSRRAARTVVVLPVLILLGGCGAGRVTADDVADAVADQVESQVGARPDVRCPDDLEAEVGASARCTLALEEVDGEYGVTVTVTSVEDDQAHFDVQVDREPRE